MRAHYRQIKPCVSTNQISGKLLSMDKKNWIRPTLSVALIIGITTVLFLYTSGYRISKQKNTPVVDLKQTGMISAKSIPEGASVYLNNVLTTATNDTISGLTPGKYNLRIVKKGFTEWTKEIEVFPELVTDITAVLISQTPRLEPLTNTGAKYPSMAQSLDKLAYFSEDAGSPGIWIIPLVQSGLSIFRSTSYAVLKDTSLRKYSDGKSIEWSPDEKALLVQNQAGGYYTVDLIDNTIESTSSPEFIRKSWADELVKKRTIFIEKLDIPENMRVLATSPKSIWSPDEKKFLYTVQIENGQQAQLEYRVYDMEKPIPVGEKVDNLVFTTNLADLQPKVTWYSDSFHLILAEGDIDKDKRGIISLIRIDGSNRIEIYNNTLFSDKVFSGPGGDKLIIMTSFKSGNQTDLYTIGIR